MLTHTQTCSKPINWHKLHTPRNSTIDNKCRPNMVDWRSALSARKRDAPQLHVADLKCDAAVSMTDHECGCKKPADYPTQTDVTMHAPQYQIAHESQTIANHHQQNPRLPTQTHTSQLSNKHDQISDTNVGQKTGQLRKTTTDLLN